MRAMVKSHASKATGPQTSQSLDEAGSMSLESGFRTGSRHRRYCRGTWSPTSFICTPHGRRQAPELATVYQGLELSLTSWCLEARRQLTAVEVACVNPTTFLESKFLPTRSALPAPNDETSSPSFVWTQAKIPDGTSRH